VYAAMQHTRGTATSSIVTATQPLYCMLCPACNGRARQMHVLDVAPMVLHPTHASVYTSVASMYQLTSNVVASELVRAAATACYTATPRTVYDSTWCSCVALHVPHVLS